MKIFIITFFVCLSLAGCKFEFENVTPKADIPCYEIKKIEYTYLINKCSGETWMQVMEADEKKAGEVLASRTYRWYKINRTEAENGYAGY